MRPRSIRCSRRVKLALTPIVRAVDRSRAMHDLDAIVDAVKKRHDIRVRRWRRSMSGCAWRVWFSDGRSINWIEAPRPRTPLSLAIFLHEVGHHVIGFDTYKLRCEEELAAWRWAIEEMRRLGVTPDARTLDRFNRSMQYALGKAMRRGIKRIPDQLQQFIPQAA